MSTALRADQGRIRITFKLYATLMKYLPEANRRSNAVEIEIEPDATLADIILPFGLPFAACFLVLVNGEFLSPSLRHTAHFADGDVIAIWPPVAGG